MQSGNKNFLLVLKSLITISCIAFLTLWIRDHVNIFYFPKKFNLIMALAAVVLMALNYYIESIKWQKALQPLFRIKISTAFKGICIGIASSMLMPNRSGEFAGRMFVVPSAWRVQAAVLTIISNMTQLLATILIGGIGMYFCFEKVVLKNIIQAKIAPGIIASVFWITIALLISTILFYLVFVFAKKKIIKSWREVRKIKINKSKVGYLFLLSTLRFLVFTIQFVLLLLSYAMPLPLLELVSASAATFFLITSIPSFALVELVARVGITSFVFSTLGGDGNSAAAAALLLWLINVALPSIAGLLFIWRIKSERA
ncbi:MAG: flippase-like domain-containing protein [Bacteroidetes bacterium]|nr:flippase-like domain-containing protein [Bacteroidota bacterium]